MKNLDTKITFYSPQSNINDAALMQPAIGANEQQQESSSSPLYACRNIPIPRSFCVEILEPQRSIKNIVPGGSTATETFSIGISADQLRSVFANDRALFTVGQCQNLFSAHVEEFRRSFQQSCQVFGKRAKKNMKATLKFRRARQQLPNIDNDTQLTMGQFLTLFGLFVQETMLMLAQFGEQNHRLGVRVMKFAIVAGIARYGWRKPLEFKNRMQSKAK